MERETKIVYGRRAKKTAAVGAEERASLRPMRGQQLGVHGGPELRRQRRHVNNRRTTGGRTAAGWPPRRTRREFCSEIQNHKGLAKCDPAGLFICDHCVGSEFWTAASSLNCRNTTVVLRLFSCISLSGDNLTVVSPAVLWLGTLKEPLLLPPCQPDPGRDKQHSMKHPTQHETRRAAHRARRPQHGPRGPHTGEPARVKWKTENL